MTEFADKKTAREYFSELRKNIAMRAEKEALAAENVLSCERVKNADAVLIYCSVGTELSTRGIIQRLIDSGKTVALPKCGEYGKMDFHIITSADQLAEGKFKIPEPDGSLPKPVITDKTVCIVPALAFTERGLRLGYGGGFYDRYISAYPQLYRIGLIFDELISGSLPAESHDAAVNAIITEKRKVFCSAE